MIDSQIALHEKVFKSHRLVSVENRNWVC